MKTTFSRFLAVTMALVLVLTCMISGFAVSVAAEDTATEPTFGVNLFTNKTYTKTLSVEKDMYQPQQTDGTGNKLYDPEGNPLLHDYLVGNDRGLNFALDEALVQGLRYVVRFEAKGLPASVSPMPGKWGQNVVTQESTDWVTYQTAFTVGTMSDYNKLWVSLTLEQQALDATGTFEMRNVELLYAPADGRFNLVPDSGFDNAGTFGIVQAQVAAGGAKIVKDPFGSDNRVMHLIKGGAGDNYNSLPSIFDELDYTKAFKIKMRLYGYFRFDNWGGQDKYMNNPGASQSSGQYTCYQSPNGWTTIEFFIDMKNNFNYLCFNNCNASSTSVDTYIDDVEIYEISPEKSTSWTVQPTTKVDAVGGPLDMNAYAIVTEPANSSPYGDRDTSISGYISDANLNTGFTWTIEGGKTNYYDSTAKTFTGTEIDALTATTAGRATLAAPNAGGATQYSLANVNPTLTVTDGTQTLTTKVEWEYTSHPLKHGDFELGSTGWGGSNSSGGTTGRIVSGNGVDGSYGYQITTGTLYANQSFFVKPNSTYRVTAKVKSAGAGVSMSAYSGGPYNLTYNKPSVEAADLPDTGWYTITGSIVTGDAPAWGSNSFNIGGKSTSADVPAYIDDIVVELVDESMDVIVGGDFDAANAGTVRAEAFNSGLTFDHILPGEIEGGIGGNTSGMLKVNPGIKASDATSTFYPVGFDCFKPFHVYEISFKHYGDAGTFTAITWSQSIVAAGGGTKTMKASTEWTEYKLVFVPGSGITNNGNWSYLFDLASPNATEAYYIDDFSVKEVQTTYLMRGYEKSELQDQVNLKYGTLNLYKGYTQYTNGNIGIIEPGTKMTVTVAPSAGYLPIPGTLELVTLSGKRTPILNSALAGMSESKGNEFTFVTTDETAYVTCEFAKIETQGYQWGTIASAVRRDEGVINGMRFLNRLYIDGLDWSASELKTTVDGVEYTIMEIGAKARVYDAAATTTLFEDTTVMKGICYEDGNPNVKVTDYTQQYFDFTVVIPIAENADHNVKYECGSYMVLKPAEGETITVYTTAMVDSVAAAVGRGA